MGTQELRVQQDLSGFFFTVPLNFSYFVFAVLVEITKLGEDISSRGRHCLTVFFLVISWETYITYSLDPMFTLTVPLDLVSIHIYNQ